MYKKEGGRKEVDRPDTGLETTATDTTKTPKAACKTSKATCRLNCTTNTREKRTEDSTSCYTSQHVNTHKKRPAISQPACLRPDRRVPKIHQHNITK